MLAFLQRSIVVISLAFCMELFAEEISVNQAIDLALANAPEIKMAEAEKRAQQNKSVSSWLELGPRASLSYNHVFFDGQLKVPMGGAEMLIRDEVTKNGSLTITQPLSGLFALGQRGRLESSKLDLKQTALSLQKSQTAFKIAELYFKSQQAARMWQIAKASIEAKESLLKDGQALFRAERIHKGDLLKFELGLSQAQLAEAKARSAAEIARFSLFEMIGVTEPEKYEIAELSSIDFESPRQQNLDESLSLALENRLELKQAVLGEGIAAIARLAGFARFFPSINFFAQYDRDFGNAGFGKAKDSKMLGLNLSFEFFNSGAHIFEIREASANLAKAQYQVHQVRQMLRIDLMQALSSLKAANETLALAKKALEQASESLRIEKLQFSLGRSTATSLILAGVANTEAEGNLVSVITELKVQQLKLQQAQGVLRPKI